MPIETAADLDVFFSEEFGEAAVYTSPAGESVALVAIRDQGTLDLRLGIASAPSPFLLFDLRADLVTPVEGGILELGTRDPVSGVFTVRETFAIAGEPRRVRQGASWSCEVAPA